MQRSLFTGLIWGLMLGTLLAQDPAPAAKPGPIIPLEVASNNWSINTLHEISASILEAANWPVSSRNLLDWLEKNYSAEAVEKPAWQWVAGLQRWCELFAANPSLASQLDRATLSWLLQDDALTADFFANLSAQDKKPVVLAILQQLHQAEPTRFPKYDSLALALALVWDTPRPAVPHHQVTAVAASQDASTVLDKFRFWVETNEKKTSAYDLAKLEAEQLKFVVDAAAPIEELQWAQHAARFGRGTLGQAFFSIKYDEGRLNRGDYVWPYPSYSLQEIRKHGGICVDQAYFAAMAGKANGIPTILFTGEGRRGPHAWFGYRSDVRWITDCGRYQYDKYATGTAIDPQTDEPITDHEIAFLAEAFHGTKEYRASQAQVRQAALFQADGDSVRAFAAVAAALKLSPQNLEAWNLKTEFLRADPKNAAAIPPHLQAMIIQFARYPDIKIVCQQKLADLARQDGDPTAANQLEDRMLRENRVKRHDLSIEMLRKKMEECCRKEDWKGGRAVVHDAIVKLHDEVGDVFALTAQYVALCLQANKADEASQALKDFKNRTKPDPIVARQLETLQKQVKEALKNR